MKDGKIEVLIADDQELVRRGYEAILGTYPDITVVGVTNDGLEALEATQRLKPDVVLMDIRMPKMNGIEATRAITANPTLPDVHVLVLTTFDIDELVFDAFEAGAGGFLLKDAEPDEIASAIRIVARGDSLIQPSVLNRLVRTFVSAGRSGTAHSEEHARTLASLTEREREILSLVAKGIGNEEIGAELAISPATVKTHIARIMSKTDSHDRAQLVVFAYESGLVGTS